MEDIAYSVSFRIDDEDKLEISAVTRSGVLHFYSVENLSKSIDEMSSKPLKPRLTIEIANDSPQLVEPIPICTVSMEFARSQKKIQIGYGDRQILRFELIAPDFNERRQILVRSSAKSSQSDTHKRTANALKTITPIINMADVEFQTKDAAPARKGQKTIEIPMETRLENLTFDSTQSSDKQGRNIAQLLVQALHSHDASLLRMVFVNKDEQLIRSTLKRLPPQYIGSLVTELTALAQKKTTQLVFITSFDFFFDMKESWKWINFVWTFFQRPHSCFMVKTSSSNPVKSVDGRWFSWTVFHIWTIYWNGWIQSKYIPTTE